VTAAGEGDVPAGTGAGTHSPSGRPLADLRVVEFASFVAGPSAGLMLAQLGADVVRVDPIGGANDHYRWPVAPSGESLYWASLNRGKRSVTVDVRSEAGRELVTALATAGSGVFLDNAVGQRWLSYEALSARRPELVHVACRATGTGGRPSPTRSTRRSASPS
jgi:2-methylfumaryl-CoA isomerase